MYLKIFSRDYNNVLVAAGRNVISLGTIKYLVADFEK